MPIEDSMTIMSWACQAVDAARNPDDPISATDSHKNLGDTFSNHFKE